MTNTPLLATSLCLGLLVASCGGPPQPAVPTAAPAAWSNELSREEKTAFMKVHVEPRMSKVFKEMDPTRHADFGCKTCHGPVIGFPRDFLPKLAMQEGKLTAFADKPQVAKFMAEKVVPEMASILGKPPFDPATKQGFGCKGCHTIDMK